MSDNEYLDIQTNVRYERLEELAKNFTPEEVEILCKVFAKEHPFETMQAIANEIHNLRCFRDNVKESINGYEN